MDIIRNLIRGPKTQDDVVLSPSEAMAKATRLMDEELPGNARIIAFTVRVYRGAEKDFALDMLVQARKRGFTVATRAVDAEVMVVQFIRKSP